MAKMTEQDWDKCLGQWSLSLIGLQSDAPAPAPAPASNTKTIPYVKKGRSSHKAQFYITEDSMSGDFGFWCPKRIINTEHEQYIIVPQWFDEKIVEFL